MSKKIGLALGSGGARGVAHLGVIKALEEEGIRPDYITGCSMGSVVGAGYSMGLTVEEMYSIVKKLKAVQLIDVTALPITRMALTRGNKMRNLLVSKLGDATFEDLKIPFQCVASDLYSGRLVTLSEGKVATAVAASSSMPTVFPPVKTHGQMLIDGGVLCRVPTQQCKDMGADVVIAVDVLDNTKEKVKKVTNIVSMVMRVFDMMDYNGSEMKKQLLGTENEYWLVPEMKGLSQYAVKDADRAYEEGYLTTRAHIEEIKEFIK
ncbi:MAG: patatin-like phospholipase family protein [Clostridia bacterium]|nr:patatin-like phospholipase family protein [Clostridia bacterium]